MEAQPEKQPDSHGPSGLAWVYFLICKMDMTQPTLSIWGDSIKVKCWGMLNVATPGAEADMQRGCYTVAWVIQAPRRALSKSLPLLGPWSPPVLSVGCSRSVVSELIPGAGDSPPGAWGCCKGQGQGVERREEPGRQAFRPHGAFSQTGPLLSILCTVLLQEALLEGTAPQVLCSDHR